MNEFLTYCNTRQFFTHRWKGDVFSNAFYLSDADLKRWHVTRSQLESMPEIKKVDMNKYNIEGVSEIDITLLKPHGQPLTDLHRWMLDRVCETDLPDEVEGTPYWKCFIRHRENYPELFFSVGVFAGRVHTPISGMSRNLRPLLLLRNEKTCSFDLSQAQPMFLGEVLRQAVGRNSFTDTINEGKDIYLKLMTAANLKTRDEAKKMFYAIAFGKPDNQLYQYFKDRRAADWINCYKSTPEPRNPKPEKIYNNLSWLLQTLEVRTMTNIWRALAEEGIPYLSVHDEIICRAGDAGKVEKIMSAELSKHFTYYKLNEK